MMDLWPAPLLHSLTELVDQQLGLHFAPDRASDLQRGIAAAARDLGFADGETFAVSLLSNRMAKVQRDVVARHLTIGETYFFRDRQAFEAIQERVLPELINARRGREQRLRIWSAACCSGEEAYSLAICVRHALPDLADWHVSILGSDLNPEFLQKATRGVFSEWSFRNTPPDFRKNYFAKTGGAQWEILPEVRRMVNFCPLNLAGDVYPSIEHGTQAMDLIFCRNALIYFTAGRAANVVHGLGQCLTESGWLVLGPNEVSYASVPGLAPIQFPGCIFHRKDSSRTHVLPSFIAPLSHSAVPVIESQTSFAAPFPAAPLVEPTPIREAPSQPNPDAEALTDFERAKALYDQGNCGEAATVLGRLAAAAEVEPRALILLARALANQGKLTAAVAASDRVLLGDKLNHTAHYLRASILQELGDLPEAGLALKRALYLEPNFILAHFALGNVFRLQGKFAESDRYLGNALTLTRAHQPDEILPEADGLTAGRLAEIISAIRAMKAVA